MIRKHIYIIIGTCVLFLSGCNNDVVVQPDTEQVPIAFSAMMPSVTVETHTRATDFPNNGQIAVVAANAISTTPIASTDWSSGNIYLNHLAATVGEKVGTIYPVTFNPKQYWPFDPDKYLSFVAYSPATHNSLSHSDTDLTVDITGKPDSFPDLLYTAPVGPYNKKSNYNSELGRANLGEFQHAMARLVIKVIAVNQHGVELTDTEYNLSQVQAIQISSLAIKTKATKGVFDLLSSGWTLTASEFPAVAQTVYTLISTNTSLPYKKEETAATAASTYYLLPNTTAVNTVKLSEISFKVKDTSPGGIEVGGDYALDAFKQIDDTFVTLEAGKTTLLTIKVQLTAIPPITPLIQLQGQLVEWDYKGKSIVEIQ